MAEIAVNLVIDNLIPLLRYEVAMLKEVHSQVASIKDQLGLIRAYLKDADVKAEKEEKSDVVKVWVKQVREVAHRIEDVIDEYLLQVAQRRQKRGLAGVLEKISRLLRSIEPRHGITSEIREINDVIATLDKRKDTLGFIQLGGKGHDLRRGALFIEDMKLVGINDTRKELKSLLLAEDSRRTVIGIVGTVLNRFRNFKLEKDAISGFIWSEMKSFDRSLQSKTTITKKLFEKQKEKRFDCGAWITVSSTFKEKRIFKSMLQKLQDQEDDDDDSQAMLIEKLNKETIIRKVRDFLQDKSYLIVSLYC